jgi:hypothetical protein
VFIGVRGDIQSPLEALDVMAAEIEAIRNDLNEVSDDLLRLVGMFGRFSGMLKRLSDRLDNK